MDTLSIELSLIDWIALGMLLAGYFYGFNKGLGRVFGFMLWLIAAMWLGRSLAPSLLSWMPDGDQHLASPESQFTAYGSVTGALLLLPLLGKLLGGSSNKTKKTAEEAHNKHFGSLVGVVTAGLFFTLACPYAHRFESVSQSYEEAASPGLAAGLASHMSYLYPAAHLEALLQTMPSSARAKHRERISR